MKGKTTKGKTADPTKLMEQADKAKAQRKADKKAKRMERKEQKAQLAEKHSTGLHTIPDKKGNGSRVVNAAGNIRAVTFATPESLQGDYKNIKDAKLAAREESRQHRKPLYLNVMADGSFSYSLKYDKDSSSHCFRNGAEVAMVIPTKSAAKQNKQTVETENSQVMATIKGKPAKKATSQAVRKVEGTKKEMKVKDIIVLLKKGVRVLNKKGKLFNINKLKTKSADLLRTAFVQSKAA